VNPLKEPVAAVSIGILKGTPLLDLCYVEDAAAEVDLNLVMTAGGKFVEVQGSGEESTFTEEQLHAMLALGRQGIQQLVKLQEAALAQ
jgi:ribonuclease PH